ncbi:TPA: 16S rRNA (guanine(527)-N(7))-methyltransferase RsmG [Clostridioides difficile]|nr:16S rRNA (guanine(527)-N(7))-methyltransferase RsmG [Clostridioides difficile]
MNNMELLKNGIEGFNIDTNDSMLEKFKIYREILIDWNKKMNLTGIEDEKEVYIKHFLDSISAVKNGYIKNGMSIIDVGTGAGFPGIPLKICLDRLELTLLDSLNKRINFLEEVSRVLELEESQKAIDVLGLEYIEKIDVELPEIDLNHNILVFKKVMETPVKYPRKAGKPAKNPIK